MRRPKLLAFSAGLLLAACVTTQQVQVTVSPPPVAAQWQGAWGGSIGGGVTALPGGGLTFPSGQILAPDGTVAAPSYAFASNPDTGWYFLSGGITASIDNLRVLSVSGGGIYVDSPPLVVRDLANSIFGGIVVGSGSIEFWAPTVPGTPAAGRGVLYMKADKKLYFKNDAGVETALF